MRTKKNNISKLIIVITIFAISITIILFLYMYINRSKINSLADYKSYADQIINYDQLKAIMGGEGKNIGSGLYIFDYALPDGSILFSFSSLKEKPVAISCFNKASQRVDCLTLKVI